jgi:hypothetical protein
MGKKEAVYRVWIQDSVLFDSRIRSGDHFLSGSQIQPIHSETLVTIFGVQNTLILCHLAHIFFVPVQKNKSLSIF